jgi:malate dehydrogenase
MGTVCIVGAGELGGAITDALARGEQVSGVLLIDAAGTVAVGKTLDIKQSGAIQGFHTRLDGTDDFTRVAGCSVCVVADKSGQPSVEWQGDEGLAMLTRLLPYLGDMPIVFAGTAQAGLIESASREAKVRHTRLIGSGPEALAAAITAVVAMEAQCSPSEVRLTVLGAPQRGFIVPWSEASIGGYALERVLTQVQLNRLEARAARLWPPGPYTLGLAAAQVVEALVSSSRRAFSVLTMLDGEFGVKDRAGVLPALLSTPGIVHKRIPTLTTRERVQLETVLSDPAGPRGPALQSGHA